MLNTALSSAPVLNIFDYDVHCCIICDASDYCVGAVLENFVENDWHPVDFFAIWLNSAERNYSATERDFVAIKMSLYVRDNFLLAKSLKF